MRFEMTFEMKPENVPAKHIPHKPTPFRSG